MSKAKKQLDDWKSGLIPWFGSRGDLMGRYIKYWPKKADVAFDLFGGGASALPWMSPRYDEIHFSDLAIESTHTIAWICKYRDIAKLQEEMTLICSMLMGKDLDTQRLLIRELFDASTDEVERQYQTPLRLAALPLILGYFLYGGKQGSRWCPGIKKRTVGSEPLSEVDILSTLKRANTNLVKFFNYTDLDKIWVHRVDYTEILKLCLEKAAEGKKVFVWADPPFPMQERGAKDPRVKDKERSMTRAQYRYDMMTEDHDVFLDRLQPLVEAKVRIVIPSYSNERYDSILLSSGWDKYLLASTPGFAGLTRGKYYFERNPVSESTRELRGDFSEGGQKSECDIVRKVQFSQEDAIAHLEAYSEDQDYKNLLRNLLRNIPTLSEVEAPRGAAPVTNRSMFWHRCKNVVYSI